MGVIVKYQLEFPEVGLKISNDLFKGAFIIDADISATFQRTATGSSFEIKLYDLPKKKAEELAERVKISQQPVRALIRLGYFDSPFDLVMEGAVTKVVAAVSDSKLITTVKGEELGTYALKRAKVSSLPPSSATIADAVKMILQHAHLPPNQIDQTPDLQNLIGNLQDKTLRGRTVMQVLDEMAEYAGAELLVADKKIYMGRPIKVGPYSPPKLQDDVNLVLFEPFVKNIPEESEPNLLKPLSATDASGFRFTITGDPKLRSGNKVAADAKGFSGESAPEFRVHTLSHKLTMSGGYVCEGVAIKAESDEQCRRREAAVCLPTAESIAESLTRRAQVEQRHRPSIEIGKVKTYTTPQHLSALYFGQRSERTETQPSIRTEVDSDENQLLRNKPIVSPFAWRKCGLVTPVYPGMKALLAHNLNLHDDALVVGFLWSEKPAFEPPQNKDGDWWLCLPIDFDTTNPPADSAKAVNDLIANNGKRVIEVKGLKITVGADKLPNVGARPNEGADDEFLIEHKSGTKFKIAADGAITIEANSVSIKGDVTIEGNVEIK
jgi:hypothetical protein